MRFVGGKILDFAPMAPGETKVFHVESTSGACDLLVRARFSRGQRVSSGAHLCDPRGKAFVDHGSSIKIVFRDQLGF